MTIKFATITFFILGILQFVEAQVCVLPTLIPYRKGNLWGYSNAERKIIIPAKYNEAKPFGIEYDYFNHYDENFATVKKGKIVYRINSEGKEFTEKQLGPPPMLSTMQEGFVDKFEYEPPFGTEKFSGHYYILNNANKEGITNGDSIIIKPEYDSAVIKKADSHVFFILKKEGNWGVLKENTTVAIDFKYSSIKVHSFWGNKTFWILKKDNKYEFRDKDFNLLIQSFYDDLTYKKYFYGEKYIAVKKNNLWGLLDFTGMEVIKNKYNFISLFNSTDNIFLVKKGVKSFYVSCNGVEFFEN
jgi:hypothetical protein